MPKEIVTPIVIRGIEAAEQQPGDDRVDQEVERNHPGQRPASAGDRGMCFSSTGGALSPRTILEQPAAC
jgi:hypothetical protein